MIVEMKTRRYFTCPNGCGGDGARGFEIEHLFEGMNGYGTPCRRQAGPWYCGTCGQGWMMSVLRAKSGEESCFVTVHNGADGKMRRQLIVLEIPPQNKPIRFVVRDRSFKTEIDHDANNYFYEEHTCPTNWLKDVKEVSIGDDYDPHGLVKYKGLADDETITRMKQKEGSQ